MHTLKLKQNRVNKMESICDYLIIQKCLTFFRNALECLILFFT